MRETSKAGLLLNKIMKSYWYLYASTKIIAALRDALYDEDLCPECCGGLNQHGYCTECNYDARLEVEERHVCDDL